MVDLLDRHHEGVAVVKRCDREEGHADVVAPDEAPRKLTVDDAREDARHRPSLHAANRPRLPISVDGGGAVGGDDGERVG